ncbi:hypothetical protein Pyn_20021 [Prunus yedoensis var. nudiflora]|uniref:Uncharacterized protein n=1 Tax=Prunus yedoensis var. nudiflora TaxID=2094558 RepID=A0A314YDX9_PRUYE|nr:hypothetical protein Pyn_20021 [Prunus yedoensis var. nudiflora]
MAGAPPKMCWITLVLLLVLGFASCSPDSSEPRLPKTTPTSPSSSGKSHSVSPVVLEYSSRKLNSGMLPKAPYPPSRPSTGGNASPLNFGMLPKTPYPPSNPSTGGNARPTLLASPKNLVYDQRFHLHHLALAKKAQVQLF